MPVVLRARTRKRIRVTSGDKLVAEAAEDAARRLLGLASSAIWSDRRGRHFDASVPILASDLLRDLAQDRRGEQVIISPGDGDPPRRTPEELRRAPLAEAHRLRREADRCAKVTRRGDASCRAWLRAASDLERFARGGRRGHRS